ncbi:hypothetical protein [Streptomyces sp. NPDC001492]
MAAFPAASNIGYNVAVSLVLVQWCNVAVAQVHDHSSGEQQEKPGPREAA